MDVINFYDTSQAVVKALKKQLASEEHKMDHQVIMVNGYNSTNNAISTCSSHFNCSCRSSYGHHEFSNDDDKYSYAGICVTN